MYKTGVIKVKTQILQTIFAQLPQTAKKVKLSAKFDDNQKLNLFKKLEAERQEDEQQCVSIESESSSQDQEILETDKKSLQQENKDKIAPKKQVVQKLRYQKMDISLEEGIIYKQFYEKQFEMIGDTYKVKIKIRAQKITFEGYDIEDIEDAMDDVKSLKDHIEVQYIAKCGQQISESGTIISMLDKIGVKIFRILDKYYRWYEVSPKLSFQDQKKKRTNIKDLLRKIDERNHCLQYLHGIQKDLDRFKGSLNNEFFKLRQKYMHYRPLLEVLKAQIFEKELKTKMNEQSQDDQLQVELSINRDALVFHSIAKQLMQMTIKDVKIQYQYFDYFFITIDSDHPIQEAIDILNKFEYEQVKRNLTVKQNFDSAQQIKQQTYIHYVTNYEKVKSNIEKKLNDPGFCADYIPKQSVIFCIGFKRASNIKLVYLENIVTQLQNLWGGVSYKFSIPLQSAEQIDVVSVSSEFNQAERIFSLTANQPSLQTNLFILKQYIIKKKMQLKKAQQLNDDQSMNNITLSTVNASQFIDETNLSIDTSNIVEKLKNQNNMNQMPNNQNQQKDQKCMKILQNYKVFLAETNKQYNQKYKEKTIKQNIIVRVDKRNRGLEDQLSKIVDCNFQVFKVQINPKHKIQSFYQDPVKDQIVSVFLSGKISPFVKNKQTNLKIEQGLNDSFSIRLLGIAKQTISENGYLLNIKKRCIEVYGKSFKIKYGAEFEVAKEIVYLKK